MTKLSMWPEWVFHSTLSIHTYWDLRLEVSCCPQVWLCSRAFCEFGKCAVPAAEELQAGFKTCRQCWKIWSHIAISHDCNPIVMSIEIILQFLAELESYCGSIAIAFGPHACTSFVYCTPQGFLAFSFNIHCLLPCLPLLSHIRTSSDAFRLIQACPVWHLQQTIPACQSTFPPESLCQKKPKVPERCHPPWKSFPR